MSGPPPASARRTDATADRHAASLGAAFSVIGDVLVAGVRARSSSLRLVIPPRFEAIADSWSCVTWATPIAMCFVRCVTAWER